MSVSKHFKFIKLLPLLWLPFVVVSQQIKTPLEVKNFEELSGYDEMARFINQIDNQSNLVSVEIIGKSVEGRDVRVLKFSKSEFGIDKRKTKVLVFAQQHGNEQSGKEGALLLAAELIKPENHFLFDKIDLALIPQVNPDGSEVNERRNAHNTDLNRNHLVLEEPEVIALHRFFDRYLFEVTMDVHEYAPFFSESWKAFGYHNNSDELIGVNTNCNIPVEIRDYSNDIFVPFYREYLTQRQISNSIYTPGGPPEINYIRHSTFDINDGRQSFGIQNTLSFIQEGLNGRDMYKERIRQRATGQKAGIMALLEFTYANGKTIRKLVGQQRETLTGKKPVNEYAIQMKHVQTGEEHPLPVCSFSTGKDTVIMVKDYRPLVKPVYTVKRPVGYLVPNNRPELVNWCNRHNLQTQVVPSLQKFKIEQYHINKIDSIDFETEMVINPEVTLSSISNVITGEYIFIPVNQLKGYMIIAALEPKSMLGLVTYPSFSHLIKAGENFPVLRVVRK